VNKKLVVYDQRVDVAGNGDPVAVKNAGEEIAFSNNEPLRLECQAFLDAIRTRRPPLTDGASGVDVLRVLTASHRSLIMNGASVVLPETGLSIPELAQAR
jgi:predicted dehydrogenase